MLSSIKKYIDRIGAEVVRDHDRKFVIYSDDDPGYGKVRKTEVDVTIDKDGVIKVFTRKPKADKARYSPTDEEKREIAEAVREAIASGSMAVSCNATDHHFEQLKLKIKEHAKLQDSKSRTGKSKINRDAIPWDYRSKSGEEILFVQHRCFDEDGEKFDVPWCFFSDGQWRRREPDGLLPLWGLDKIGNGKPVMLHEGAKAAAFCSVESNIADHPLAAELRDYVHVGWPGGALNSSPGGLVADRQPQSGEKGHHRLRQRRSGEDGRESHLPTDEEEIAADQLRQRLP